MTNHIHLVKDMEIAHGIDIHAAQVAPSKHFAPIPGKTDLSYDFDANVPGAFMYHCSAPLMVTHIANGMYGMMIVDPRGGWSKAQEVTIGQGVFYGDPDDKGLVSGDSKRMMDERPDFVVFNGVIEKYSDHPIQEPVRIFFVNAGPTALRASTCAITAISPWRGALRSSCRLDVPGSHPEQSERSLLLC